MQILDFLFSRSMIITLLGFLVFYFIFKNEPEVEENEPEDIEGHLAGFDQLETTDQAINHYRSVSGYNELRSQAFVNKMAELHKGPTLS